MTTELLNVAGESSNSCHCTLKSSSNLCFGSVHWLYPLDKMGAGAEKLSSLELTMLGCELTAVSWHERHFWTCPQQNFRSLGIFNVKSWCLWSLSTSRVWQQMRRNLEYCSFGCRCLVPLEILTFLLSGWTEIPKFASSSSVTVPCWVGTVLLQFKEHYAWQKNENSQQRLCHHVLTP